MRACWQSSMAILHLGGPLGKIHMALSLHLIDSRGETTSSLMNSMMTTMTSSEASYNYVLTAAMYNILIPDTYTFYR